MSSSIQKTGVFNGLAVEPFMTLADGSMWQLMMFHLVENGTRLFTSANATYCNDYGLFSRLAWINDFTYNSGYEFYVIQDGAHHRWTQTSAPTASSIEGFTLISGTTTTGLAKGTSNKTYIGYGAWWGACGAWTSYTYSGVTGIPGFGATSSTSMCADYLALYARVAAPKAFMEDGIINSNNLYEY